MKGKAKRLEVPKYPGPLPKKPPEPPKYLVQVGEDGKHALVQVKGTPPEVRPSGVGDPNVPIVAKEAETIPQRDYSSPAHYYPPRKEYIIPGSKPSKAKDSRRDVKPSVYTAQDGQVVTYSNPPTALPKLPAIPRPFVPAPARSLDDGPMIHARTASGKILGTHTRRFVNAHHVPASSAGDGGGELSSRPGSYKSVSSAAARGRSAGGMALAVSHRTASVEVGPDAPIRELSEVWSACWDDEAGATYYYNKESGEATWIMPDEVK